MPYELPLNFLTRHERPLSGDEFDEANFRSWQILLKNSPKRRTLPKRDCL
jgi:hypothetical protein